MSCNSFSNTDQTLVALIGGRHVPIVGWSSGGWPITFVRHPSDVFPPVFDTKTGLVYTYRSKDGVTIIEKYEESIHG